LGRPKGGGLRILAPAKVNLFLAILGKRADGYHEIVSVVDIISLYDVLHVEEVDRDEIFVADREGVLEGGEGNSVYRAVKIVKERFGIGRGMRIHIDKGIPIGGGLGGSSTDAAQTLKVLNQLWRLGLSMEEMIDLGKEIGSDVPLFLYGAPCIVRGRGERVEPFDLPRLTYLVVYPGIPLSAGDVYGSLERPQHGKDLPPGLEKGRLGLPLMLRNDLEPAAISLLPVIAEMKEEVNKSGAIGALLCGSGSSVFGIFKSRAQLEEARLEMERRGWYTFIARSLRRQAKPWRSRR
jgi:4-diphosphocytidyl-2-C-methyl-D-erythritol kinase